MDKVDLSGILHFCSIIVKNYYHDGAAYAPTCQTGST